MYVYFVNFMLSSFQVSVFQLLVVDRQLHLEHLHSQSCACRNVGGGCMSVECEERHVQSLCCEIRITYALVNFACMHMYMYMYMDYIRLAYFTCKSCLMVFTVYGICTARGLRGRSPRKYIQHEGNTIPCPVKAMRQLTCTLYTANHRIGFGARMSVL